MLMDGFEINLVIIEGGSSNEDAEKITTVQAAIDYIKAQQG